MKLEIFVKQINAIKKLYNIESNFGSFNFIWR